MGSFRKEKVASTIRNIVSNVIAHQLHDPRVDPLTTVTRVVMSADLLTARVYLSVHGGGAAERRTLEAILHAGGYIQRILAGNLTMRHCPELRFEIDEAVEGVRRTMELLDENLRDRLARQETNGGEDAPQAESPITREEAGPAALEHPQEGDK